MIRLTMTMGTVHSLSLFFDGLEDGEVQRSSGLKLNFTYCIVASESKSYFRDFTIRDNDGPCFCHKRNTNKRQATRRPPGGGRDVSSRPR